MKKIGRNDPCPCGNGRKYKKCCLLAHPTRPQFTAQERASPLHRLEALVDEPRWRPIEERAEAVFWGPCQEAFDQLADDDLASMSEGAFDFWFFFDHRPEGRSRVAEAFLNGATDLTDGERHYLEQAKSSCMRLYEVVEARPGESLRLRDLTSGQEVRVRERLASQQLRKWDLLAARVMPAGASGQPEIDGGCYPLPRMHREDLLAHMTKVTRPVKSLTATVQCAKVSPRALPSRAPERKGPITHRRYLRFPVGKRPLRRFSQTLQRPMVGPLRHA